MANIDGIKSTPKTNHNHLGIIGETIVSLDLLSRGCRLIKQRARIKKLEIDIIAQYGDILLLIEVRTRSTRTPNSHGSDIPIDWKKRRAVARWATALRKSPPLQKLNHRTVKIYLAVVYYQEKKHSTKVNIEYIPIY